MQLGIHLNAQHPAGEAPAGRVAETVEQARPIGALGFDSIWGGERHEVAGAPDAVVAALLREHRAGVTRAAMRVGGPDMPRADILAGIELLGRRVRPEVRRRTTCTGDSG